jgi:hypothetical protein
VGWQPSEHRLVHPLPRAPQFVGRDAELVALSDLWRSGTRGVVALVGLGGAGKTAIAARFLDDLGGGELLPRPAGLFVWSFYQEPDAGFFLEELYRYFTPAGSPQTPAKGAALIHLLSSVLAAGGANLLVLDGLERVQRGEGHAAGGFGQIEDPLLKGLLTRIGDGIGQTVALVTSRFPLADLTSALGEGYRQIDVDQLSHDAAIALLRHHGVRGDDAALLRLMEAYGTHALTLDHLGGVIGQFLGGDPEKAPQAPKFASPEHDRQALRLARLLKAYEEHLPPEELALLCRLCLLERSVQADQIVPLFLCSPAVHFRTAGELMSQISLATEGSAISHDLLLEVCDSVRDAVTVAIVEAPIAGPDHLFRENIKQAVESLELHFVANSEAMVEEVIQLYDKTNFEVSTEQRPLKWQDQQQLREAIARYEDLHRHPLFPYKKPPAWLELAFLKEGWGKYTPSILPDLTTGDVMQAVARQRAVLQRFAVKHIALRRVREICKLYQQKWRASGPLASLDSQRLHEALSGLVRRHLALREGDGSVSVHPAVRDYFSQLAASAEQGFWHQLIGEQLISLVRKPGKRLPTDKASLDLVEEAISHAVWGGETAKAQGLYFQVLGGHRHLAWKLGEMARGLRILRGFNPCPDRWAMGWYLRALGELDLAYEQNNLPFFRADIRLLQGRLNEVENEGDSARAEVARFLMGTASRLPGDALGCVIPRVQLLLYLSRTADAWLATQQPEQVYEMIGWEDDRVRCQLFRADVASRLGDGAGTARSLDDATAWILHSGSVEHLCVYHLVRARIAMRTHANAAAQSDLEEGLHLARRCGLGLYHVELLIAQAEFALIESQAVAAERAAREALGMASAVECQFRWGIGAAGQLLGKALLAQGRLEEGRVVLEEARNVFNGLGAPGY